MYLSYDEVTCVWTLKVNDKNGATYLYTIDLSTAKQLLTEGVSRAFSNNN